MMDIKKSIQHCCSPWGKSLAKLEIIKAQQITPFTSKVKRTISSKRVYEYEHHGDLTRDYFESNCSSKEISTRNILIVGWTGSGKSMLAKVLSEDKKFEDSDGSTSKTRFARSSEEFAHEDNYYCVIDNIGFGDTIIDEKRVMVRIGEAINSAYQGLSQVLFVFSGRFSDEQKESLRKLKALKITDDYITLTRSRFDNFKNKEECQKDQDSTREESSEIKELIDNCRGLLHIDNDKNDSSSQKKSREIVLNHLHENCKKNPAF